MQFVSPKRPHHLPIVGDFVLFAAALYCRFGGTFLTWPVCRRWWQWWGHFAVIFRSRLQLDKKYKYSHHISNMPHSFCQQQNKTENSAEIKSRKHLQAHSTVNYIGHQRQRTLLQCVEEACGLGGHIETGCVAGQIGFTIETAR